MLARAADVPDYTWFWWKLRPHPRLGTVEIRALDAQASLDDLAALVALVHCLARHEATSERTRPTRRPRSSRRASFRAARFGVRAELPDADGRLCPVRDLLDESLELVRDDARELGCEDELDGARAAHAARRRRGRQREAYAIGGMGAVLRETTAATATGRGHARPLSAGVHTASLHTGPSAGSVTIGTTSTGRRDARMTIMDRRDFLRRGALDRGRGDAELGGARAHGRARRPRQGREAGKRAPRRLRAGYGPLAPMADQRGHRGARAARGLQLRHLRPHRLADERRAPDAAGARRHVGVRRAARHGAPDAQPRGPQSARRGQRAGPPRPVRRAAAGGGVTTLDYDPRSRSLVRSLGEPVRQHDELRGRSQPRPAQLDHRRGDRRRAGLRGRGAALPRAPRLLLRGPDQARSRRARTSPIRSRPWAASATRRWPSTSARASSISPRTRARAWAPGFYRYLPKDPRRLHKGGRLQMLGIEARPRWTCARARRSARRSP